ncbi:SSI family serine proteinase inhibitor [Actinoallomurus soli]|uniref:SSI family serine proteinase inhibitor n=1 Tax=Actinoallomurus soli TaxID=2952535 RepID=UPI002092B5A9|nr:SSI family serine proteinase inhibitor [Actinoallomurus soli]MCO5974660.1 subtilase-type protease inhibitor [Actinoallomurus soli]
MRIILAFSIAAAIPVVFSVSAAGAQARPAPPTAGSGTGAARPHAGRHVRPAPPGAVVRDLDTSASGRSPFNERMPPAAGIGAPGSAATQPQGGAADPAAPSADPATGQSVAGPTLLTLRSAMGSGTPRTVTLQCDPVGGTHPKAAQACADLDKAGNDLTIAPDRKNPRACFMIYSPVTVSAEGQWRGRPVKLTGQYPNTCVLRDKTASIFDF